MSQKTHPVQVFLSHTKTDKEFVRRLADDLNALGFKVWFDEWELRVGDSLVGTIEKAIDESAWMIIVRGAFFAVWMRRNKAVVDGLVAPVRQALALLNERADMALQRMPVERSCSNAGALGPASLSFSVGQGRPREH